MSAYGVDSPNTSTPTPSNGVTHSPLTKLLPGSADDDEDLTFESPKEEAAYYRDKYRLAYDLLTDTRAELDDFQLSSRELEQELEKELEATETRQTELQERIQRLETEKDEWKTKFVNLQKMHSSTVTAMQREMDNLRSERDKTLVAIRDLEMGNDELERNQRVTVSSLLDMEIKYNRAIEEKTLLEQEVIQKQELEEECQRLKDDVRDANNEIAILRDQAARAVMPTPPSSDAPISDKESRSAAPSPTPTDGSTATHRSARSTSTAPSSRGERSPTITPRNYRTGQLPRAPRSTTKPVGASPSVQRNTVAASPSGIPSLSRSTTTRNLSTATGTSSGSQSGMRRSATAVNVSHQAAKTKGMRLLQDIQTRLKAADDRLGARVSRRNMTLRRTNANGNSATSGPPAAHSRVAALSRATGQSHAHQGAGAVTPNSWVIVSDVEETPPARPKREEPASPLEPARGVGGRLLPVRPGIPSPLTSSTNTRHNPGSPVPSSTLGSSTLSKSVRPSGRPPLSSSAGQGKASLSSSMSRPARPPSRGHTRASSTTAATTVARPPSRGHTRSVSRSGAMSPTQIPVSRRTSIGSTILSGAPSTPSYGSTRSRPSSRSEMRPSSRTEIRSSSRADTRSSSRADTRPSSRAELERPRSVHGMHGYGHGHQSRTLGRGHPPSRTPTMPTLPSSTSIASDATSASAASMASGISVGSGVSGASVGSKTSLASSVSGPPTPGLRRPSRRSSLGVNEINAPPTGIPGPATGRPTSVPVFSNTPPPPVPPIPTNLRQSRN